VIIQLGKYRRTVSSNWHYDREVVSIDLVEETVRVREAERSNWGYGGWSHYPETITYGAESRRLRTSFRKMKDYR
jgi:hypothetical protein